MSNFIQKCLAGEAMLDDIDEFVDEWHETDTRLPIYRFLGMTQSEYGLWVADPDVLPYIVNAHHQDRDVAELLGEISALPIAARSDGPEKAVKLLRWLKSEGLWE